jgi:hypothetical protein
MKNKLHFLIPMLGILILLGSSSGLAQSSHVIVASIPFGFNVREVSLPAGDYEVTFARHESKTIVWLKNSENKALINVISFAGEDKRLQDNAYMVFNRYGGQYFLSQIWTADASHCRELVKSRAEREVMASASEGFAHKELASRLVTVAVR